MSKIYPKFASHILKNKQHKESRLYYIMRSLDHKGTGRIRRADLNKYVITAKNLMGVLSLNNLIKKGENVWWQSQFPNNPHSKFKKGYIYIFSPKRVAKANGWWGMGHSQFIVDAETACSKLRQWKAFLYEVSLDQFKGNPVTRKKIEKVTGLSFRTQQRLENLRHIGSISNYILAETNDVQECIWEHGTAISVGNDQLAYRTANSYRITIQSCDNGSSVRKRINRELRDTLLEMRERVKEFFMFIHVIL